MAKAKVEKADPSVDVDYVELVGLVNSLTVKLAEMGTVQENLTAKLTQQGVAQEGLATKTIVSEEKGYDIGTSEAWQANLKGQFDLFQDAGMESIRRSRSFADQIIQNAITVAKQLDTQAVRHNDLAADRQWNIDESGYTARSILSDEVFKDAIKEAVVEAVQAVKK